VSDDIRYEYASGDLLENRNTYFYAAFHGEAFLDAWRHQRDAFLAGMPDCAAVLETQVAVSPTESLLDQVYSAILAGKGDLQLYCLDRLVQRFEVTKRMHKRYNDDWRPVDADDYRALGPYVRLAEVLELAYVRTHGLQYFNALLKCLDTLTALRDRLDNAQVERVKRLVRAERAHVERLAVLVAGGPDEA
jgi:methionyl-tRNA formyltransferase